MDCRVFREEITKLKSEKQALQVQRQLLENFITLVRSSSRQGMLHTMLQKAVDVASELSGAEKGSLFLMDDRGVVTDCIIMRKSVTSKEKRKLIAMALNNGLAGWAAAHRKSALVQDTAKDPRWIDIPDQPYAVRSAMVVPILKGETLFGVLTLVHSRPEHFEPQILDFIQATAGQIAIVLENVQLYTKLSRAYHSLELAKKKIDAYSTVLSAELEKGRRMQRSMLPSALPQIPDWKISACFHPARQVSGDFYDVFRLPEHHLGLIIADVCDKGVSAALFMGIFRSLLRVFLENLWRGSDSESGGISESRKDALESVRSIPCESLKAIYFLNQYIEKYHGDEGIFATLFLGVINTRSGCLTYLNAGHEPLLIIRADSDYRKLPPTGPAVGVLPEVIYHSETLQIDAGDTLLGFTDGVTDACSEDGRFFGRQGVYSALHKSRVMQADILKTLEAEAFHHIGSGELADDIAMLSVSRIGG